MHPSMMAAKWAMPKSVAFRHNDIEALEKRLKRLPPEKLQAVILRGLYSMLGDVAPLDPHFKEAGAMVLVDEAHSMGFIAKSRGDNFEEQGVIDDVDFIIGTDFSTKAFARRRSRTIRVRNPAPRFRPFPPLLPAQRCDIQRRVNPQADAQWQQTRAFVGKQQDIAQRPARSGLSTRH